MNKNNENKNYYAENPLLSPQKNKAHKNLKVKILG
jgi:hypothetical protein